MGGFGFGAGGVSARAGVVGHFFSFLFGEGCDMVGEYVRLLFRRYERCSR